MRDRDHIALEIWALRARLGDHAAWAELVAATESRLTYFVHRLVGNEHDAYDVMQSVWIKAMRSIGSLRDASRVLPWLYRIARHEAFDYGSMRRAYGVALEGNEAVARAALPCIPPDDFAPDDAERVHAALDRLTLPHREVLTLYFLESMPIADIATILDIPPGTVKSRLHLARARLRQELHPHD